MSTSRRDNRQEQELRAIIDDIPGNDKCADCEALSPRWASYSLGVFLCTRCASIHRKNSDMSKVKSISLDSWTPDQVQRMREVGNTISNYKYNPLREWPMQDDDSTMEQFIRDKYERQKFMSQRETANFTPVKSAMKGSAKPVEPGKTSSSVIKYSKELDTLKEMGFTDRARNVDVLKSVMGDVASATDVLFNMDGGGSQASSKKKERPRVRFTADTIGGEEQAPQMQAANPFAMWSSQGQGGPSGPQQDFSNPFSSIPPSMYNNQNFVQNVQNQGQPAAAPFMGYQTTGQDAIQQQYSQPAMPLRAQVTGGQPLRPQMTAPMAPEPPQAQPLRHQLTGRAPPPAPPAQPPQQQYQNQQYQQAPPNVFQQQRPDVSQGQSYQGQTFGQQPPQSAANSYQPNAFQHPDNSQRPPVAVSTPALTPQLTGNMRPKFKPTVDLNAPFGQVSQPSQAPPQNQFQAQPQQFGGQLPNQNQFRTSSPQISSLYQQQQQQPSVPTGTFNQGPFRPIQNQLTGMPNRISPQQSGIPSRPEDPFGSSFTSPLRAQLTGIEQQTIGRPQNATQSQSNGFENAHYQPAQAQYPSMNFNANQQQSAGMSAQNNNNFSQPNQYQGQMAPQNQYGSQQPLFAQNTGTQQPQPNRMYPQNTGGQGFSTAPQNQASQFLQQNQPQLRPFSPAQQPSPVPYGQPANAYPQTAQPANAYQQPQQQYGQQQMFNQPFQPQQTGYGQTTQMGGINPSKPFDKASILSLYGGAQQPPAPQQQRLPPQQQQQYMNGYGQQDGNMYGRY